MRTIALPNAIYRIVFIGEREPTEAEALQADSPRDVLSELRSVESRLGDTSTHAYALSWLTPKLNRCYQPRKLGEVEVERSMRTLHRCGYLQMLTIEQDGGHELTVRYHVANWSDFRQARMATP